MGCISYCMPREKRGRLLDEAGAGYLPGNNKVKAWREQSWFFLVDCCT